MATGKRAFERESATQTLTAIIEDEPELVTLVNPKVAATTARVIDRCLSKDPAERYASTWDIAKDIHWEDPAQPSTRHPLAAVGIVGGKAAGLKVIWVNRAGEPLEDHGYVPDWEVKDFFEVAELLKRERL